MKFFIQFFALFLLILCWSCSGSKHAISNKKIWKKEVPAGSSKAVYIPAKKGVLSETDLIVWPYADLMTDSIPGISLRQANEFLKGKKVKPVLVGVIDSGIDIDHEDLKDQVWTNPEDKTVNGKDEDNNQRVDDMHGWNFLGGKEGEIVYEQNELTREYVKYSKRFSKMQPDAISEKDRASYDKYLKLKSDYEKEYNNYKEIYDNAVLSLNLLKEADEEVRNVLGQEDYTLEEVKSLPESQNTKIIVGLLSADMKIDETTALYQSQVDVLDPMLTKKYNIAFYGRKTDDDPNDISDIVYGNHHVKGAGESESHGTHVAGIILANRGNDKGIKGVTNHAQLIAVRAVPNGDEHDKDIALAIKYMADMGARVVNMSFGKALSPNPEWVYDAIKYAELKDVLLIRAAGNDGLDIDNKQYYPNDAMDNRVEFVDNVVTVGAITRHFDENLIGDFSNYGKINVDIFAPGAEIISTIPNDDYGSKQGTSMATPQVAGVAALIRAYYPELSAAQVKQILLNSGTRVDMMVNVPKTKGEEKRYFSEFSSSGRILNAYGAVKMADDMMNK